MGLTTLFLELVGWLYLFQLGLQGFQLLVRAVSGDPCHKLILLGHVLLGVTGDAVPKKAFLKHELFTYNGMVVATLLAWLRRPILENYFVLKFILGVALGVGVSYAVFRSGMYTIFKLYPEGYGAGLNFYWKGWRVIGLDWHQWVVKQDQVTGKPLHPDQQYYMNRPHVDLPLRELHHWPWVQHAHSSEVAAVKAAKDERRAAKADRKAERRARREIKLAEKASLKNATTSASEDASSPSEMDLSDFSDFSGSESAATSPLSLSPPTSPALPLHENLLVSGNHDEDELSAPLAVKLQNESYPSALEIDATNDSSRLSSHHELRSLSPADILDLPVMSDDASPSQRIQAEHPGISDELARVASEALGDAFSSTVEVGFTEE